MPVTYFELWLTRLVGFLPELDGMRRLRPGAERSRAYFHALADGLMCPDDKRLASSEISSESRTLASQNVSRSGGKFCWDAMAQSARSGFAEVSDPNLAAHIEKKLVTAGMLEKGGF